MIDFNQVGFIKSIWNIQQPTSRNLESYAGETVTFDYGVVENLDVANDLNYPIIITIATASSISRNLTVFCGIMVASSLTNFSFNVVPIVKKVTIK